MAYHIAATDDDPAIRKILNIILSKEGHTVSVCENGDHLMALLKQSRDPIDCILLDIKMPDGSGFDLLNKFTNIDFKVVFITAHEEYAIKAFRFSAIDYILKPVDPSDLISAVEKTTSANGLNGMNEQFQTFKDNYYNGESSQDKRIVLKTTENIYIIYLKDVIRCQSEKNYTYFYFTNRERIIVSKTLKDFEEILSDFGFMRIHRSHLINLKFIDRFEKSEGGFLIMNDGSKVEVSHRKKEALLNYIYGLNNV